VYPFIGRVVGEKVPPICRSAEKKGENVQMGTIGEWMGCGVWEGKRYNGVEKKKLR